MDAKLLPGIVDGLTDWERRFVAAQRGSAADLDILLASVRSYLMIIANRELTGPICAKLAPSDIVQETLLQAHCNLGDFAGNTEGQFLAWLRSILINRVNTARRTYQTTQARDIRRERSLDESEAGDLGILVPAVADTPSKFAIGKEEIESVSRVLNRLPTDYQHVLRLRYWDQLSLVAIARDMNRTPEAVQKLWFRAIERLKQELNRAETE